LKDVFVGVGSVVIYYAGLGRRPAAEFFEFNDAGLVFRSAAHYVS
jgi:hypothetical protein